MVKTTCMLFSRSLQVENRVELGKRIKASLIFMAIVQRVVGLGEIA